VERQRGPWKEFPGDMSSPGQGLSSIRMPLKNPLPESVVPLCRTGVSVPESLTSSSDSAPLRQRQQQSHLRLPGPLDSDSAGAQQRPSHQDVSQAVTFPPPRTNLNKAIVLKSKQVRFATSDNSSSIPSPSPSITPQANDYPSNPLQVPVSQGSGVSPPTTDLQQSTPRVTRGKAVIWTRDRILAGLAVVLTISIFLRRLR